MVRGVRNSVVGNTVVDPLLISFRRFPPNWLPPGGHWAFSMTPHFLDLSGLPAAMRLCTKWRSSGCKSHGSDAPHHELTPSLAVPVFGSRNYSRKRPEGGTPILRLLLGLHLLPYRSN